ncbi:MAG TPA: hypothetical protein VJV79_24560 [Polyangiaceae bacterium]|nr:hypothetical protein [Polyangiaceae bacterium]
MAKGSSWGIVATGDTNTSHVTPSFNAAGDTLAYVATDYTRDGYPSALATKADVRLVPYNSRAGGTSQPLVGASEPNALEYEPTFSPDGKLIAFSRAATGGPDGPYRNRHAELSVVPASGGDRARLLARFHANRFLGAEKATRQAPAEACRRCSARRQRGGGRGSVHRFNRRVTMLVSRTYLYGRALSGSEVSIAHEEVPL